MIRLPKVAVFLDRFAPRDAEGFTARERAESVARYRAVYETVPTAEQVARSKAAARQRAGNVKRST